MKHDAFATPHSPKLRPLLDLDHSLTNDHDERPNTKPQSLIRYNSPARWFMAMKEKVQAGPIVGPGPG